MNNTEVSDEEIMESNRTYGGLGELAILVLPQNQVQNMILNIFKKHNYALNLAFRFYP